MARPLSAVSSFVGTCAALGGTLLDMSLPVHMSRGGIATHRLTSSLRLSDCIAVSVSGLVELVAAHNVSVVQTCSRQRQCILAAYYGTLARRRSGAVRSVSADLPSAPETLVRFWARP